MDKVELIERTVSDLVADLLYYDRKEDSELTLGAIEQAIADGEITPCDLVFMFQTYLMQSLNNKS